MKKYLISLTFVLASFGAGAQSYFDEALSLSECNYYGTARSMAMGNAVTAVGGDLGSVNINPAGSAVSGFSQFILSAGCNVSSTAAAYAPVTGGQFTTSNKTSRAQFTVPTVALAIRFEPRSGVFNSITFSFAATRTNSYSTSFSTTGINPYTSKFAEMAHSAEGIPSSSLGSETAYENPNFSGLWDVITAYRGGLINSYSADQYCAVSEYLVDDMTYRYVPGDLRQVSSVSKTGAKTDILFNIGFNVSDRFYFGFNIGIPTSKVNHDIVYRESPLDPEKFPISFSAIGNTYYTGGTHEYDYTRRADGVYGKFGVIYLPTEFLRLGASVQTPTSYTITESWRHYTTSTFADPTYDLKASSYRGQSRFKFRSAYEFNLGAALTFRHTGLLSIDYEMMDFNKMGYKEIGAGVESETIYSMNLVNRLFAGQSHNFRVGGEVRIANCAAVRAGFNLSTNPEVYYRDQTGKVVTAGTFDQSAYESGQLILSDRTNFSTKRWSVSLGGGYDQLGNFFADLAVKMTRYPTSYFYPYYNYDNVDKDNKPVNVASPEIKYDRSLWDVVLTVGWRF